MHDSYSMVGGSADITPPSPIALAGYVTVREAVFDRVAHPLEANVAILRYADALVAFIALDLMYVGSTLCEKILRGLAGRIPQEAVFLSASHTHFGPPTEVSLPVLGSVSADYVEFVSSQVVTLTLNLLSKDFAPASLEYLEGRASHTINRRLKVFGVSRKFPFIGSRIQIRPNIDGPRDDLIRLIRVRGQNGKDLAVCWSFACHPVAYPHLNDLTSEFPGIVRSMLRAEFGGIPILYWQGFSGNVRPRVPAGAESPTFDSLNEAQWNDWTRSLGQRVIDTAGAHARPVGGPLSAQLRSLDVRELGLSSDKRLGFQEVRFGREFAVCGLSAEVAVEYVEVLKRLREPATVIPVGCVGAVYGYLPASSMIPEGGYEVEGFVPRFGLGGRFSSDVTEIVSSRLLRPPG
jgi:hypothetical protein